MDQIESWLQFLCCPACLADLVAVDEALACGGCEAIYPIIGGIPVLRKEPLRAKEMRRVEQLLERFDASDFRGLMRFHIGETTKDALLEVELDYELEWARRGAKQLYRIQAMARELAGEAFSINRVPGLYLDIGCGKGAMLATMAGRCERAIGLDYSLEYLILARKLFEELGADNVFLIAGSNLELPIRSGCATLLTAIDVIEHIPDQARGMAEDTRVLKPGGVIYMNSPNRYSVFAVEDHVQLWGGRLRPAALDEGLRQSAERPVVRRRVAHVLSAAAASRPRALGQLCDPRRPVRSCEFRSVEPGAYPRPIEGPADAIRRCVQVRPAESSPDDAQGTGTRR